MTFTVGTVINHARDLHPALTETNAPNPVAFRFLSRLTRDLIREIVRRVPANEGQILTVSLPLADFSTGIDLSTSIPAGWMDLLEGFFLAGTSPNPCQKVRGPFVPWEQRDMGVPVPAFTFRNNVLYFLGGAGAYAQYSQFLLEYTPLPVDVGKVSDTFNLPDDARETLALQLGAFWLKRMVGSPQMGVTTQIAGLFQGDADAEKGKFLSRVWNLAARQSYSVRDVTGFGGGGGGGGGY